LKIYIFVFKSERFLSKITRFFEVWMMNIRFQIEGMGDLAFLPEASKSIKQSRRHEVIKN